VPDTACAKKHSEVLFFRKHENEILGSSGQHGLYLPITVFDCSSGWVYDPTKRSMILSYDSKHPKLSLAVVGELEVRP
jgi:hypothetical protein